MPGFGQIASVALLLGSIAIGVDARPKYLRPRMMEIRQAPPGAPAPAPAPAPAGPAGAAPALTDLDILQL
jgi:hypothetical protein